MTSSNGSLGERGAGTANTPEPTGRGSHRSHRNRNSKGFLLLSSAFEPPSKDTRDSGIPQRRQSSRDEKGKAAVRDHDNGRIGRRSNAGTGSSVGSSPLSATVRNTATNNSVKEAQTDDVGTPAATEPKPAGLDVDSTQIVNLALNLSESRRNAARRSISLTTAPASPFKDTFAGGSLRQHLQQQRRSSRTTSPKPERGLLAHHRIGSGQKVQSPLNTTFDTQSEEGYQYRLTPSTLARAEKAKNYIGLMAEYRRLLQYVPPLKPHGAERVPTADSGFSSLLTPPRTQETASSTPHQPGREYNPLQYIRNRKVRARERKAIDGEAQGFGDLTKVSSWVDKVAAGASPEDCEAADCLPMPPFSKAAEVAALPHSPTQSKSQTSAPKIKRPRIDWLIDPADMLADAFWLEQDENKKIVENHWGNKIFSQDLELKRPMSRRDDEPEHEKSSELIRQGSPRLRLDTKLPEFSHSKVDAGKHHERTASRAKQKLLEATRLHHGHNGSAREHRLLRPRVLSDSDSSGTDGVHRPRRRSRRLTAETLEPATDILDLQMTEMLEREAMGHDWSATPESIERKAPGLKDGSVKSRDSSGRHSRPVSIVADNPQNRHLMLQHSSRQPSVDLTSGNGRVSLEELDSTAPNSPQTKASRATNAFVPSIAMDLSPPPNPISPTRHISRVRSRINPFHEHRRAHSRNGDGIETPVLAPPSGINEIVTGRSDTPQSRKRSPSPVSKVSTRKTDDGSESTGRSNQRRGRGEGQSSIIGFLKGTRGPAAKVSDFFWKREPTPTLSIPPGFSSDESEDESLRATKVNTEPEPRDTSTEAPSNRNLDAAILPSRNDKLPVFMPSEHRGRPTTARNGDGPKDSGSERQAREERRKASRANLLEIPPRIDIQSASPSSSPDLSQERRFSSTSDLESRRGSTMSGVESADARLNAMLGPPGRTRSALPVTGLTALETTHETRPSLEGKRQWSISDREVPNNYGAVTRKEIARVRALLLSSGIKAREISRRAAETVDLQENEGHYSDIAKLAKEKLNPVPNSQQHIIAARILSSDIQLSSRMWQATADKFYNTTVSSLLERADLLHSKVADNLTPMVRSAADEADSVSRNILTSQSLQIKRIIDTMDNMMRRRRRRFRWLRRGGWVLVEWALVGVMWFAWFLVVLVRIVMGLGKGVVGSFRWLFWL